MEASDFNLESAVVSKLSRVTFGTDALQAYVLREISNEVRMNAGECKGKDPIGTQSSIVQGIDQVSMKVEQMGDARNLCTRISQMIRRKAGELITESRQPEREERQAWDRLDRRVGRGNY